MAGYGGARHGLPALFQVFWARRPWGQPAHPVKRTLCSDCGLSFERADMHRCIVRGDKGRRYARRSA